MGAIGVTTEPRYTVASSWQDNAHLATTAYYCVVQHELMRERQHRRLGCLLSAEKFTESMRALSLAVATAHFSHEYAPPIGRIYDAHARLHFLFGAIGAPASIC